MAPTALGGLPGDAGGRADFGPGGALLALRDDGLGDEGVQALAQGERTADRYPPDLPEPLSPGTKTATPLLDHLSGGQPRRRV